MRYLSIKKFLSRLLPLIYSYILFFCLLYTSGSELIGYNRKGRYRMQYLPFLHLINFSEFQHHLLNMDCRSPVSYTHLDVYKRQHMDFTILAVVLLLCGGIPLRNKIYKERKKKKEDKKKGI